MKGQDREFQIAGRHILPNDLFNIVLPIESQPRSHIAVPLLLIGRGEDQVEIVLQLRPGRITPDQREFQRPPCTGNPDGTVELFALPEGAAVPEISIWTSRRG